MGYGACRVPGTKLVRAANPMEALETWLYNDVEFKAHPHVVIEQQGRVMHGFMDVIIPLMPGKMKNPAGGARETSHRCARALRRASLLMLSEAAWPWASQG